MTRLFTVTRRQWRRVVSTSAAIVGTVCLVAAAAPAGTVGPLLSLGPITIANGTATLAGHVGGSDTNELTVNGQPLGIDAGGNFSGTVNLNGQSKVDLALKNPVTGETATTSIPLTTNLTGSGSIPATVLDLLRQAGISVTIPPDGFKILDQLPLTLNGQVLDKEVLSSLKLNGVDVLSLLKPGGSFTATLPGSTKEVTITATDKEGVSQTSAFTVAHISSVIGTTLGTSVSAAGARGLRIASVRYVLKGVKVRKRVGMKVTVKDRRGYLVRGATVMVRAASSSRRQVASGQQAGLTSKIGRASFTVRLRSRAFPRAKRLFMVATAVTPTAKAKKTTSVRIPRLRHQPRLRR
jgi:hypothetical protein